MFEKARYRLCNFAYLPLRFPSSARLILLIDRSALSSFYCRNEIVFVVLCLEIDRCDAKRRFLHERSGIKVRTNRLKPLSPHRLPKFSRKSQQYRLGSRTWPASSVRESRLIQLIQSGNCFPSILALRSQVTWCYVHIHTYIYIYIYIYSYILAVGFFSIFPLILIPLSSAKWQSLKALRPLASRRAREKKEALFPRVLVRYVTRSRSV